jgi:hypothetical protein
MMLIPAGTFTMGSLASSRRGGKGHDGPDRVLVSARITS